TGKTDGSAQQRGSAACAGQAGNAGAHGAGAALLLGHELRRNCGHAGRAPRLRGRGVAARTARAAPGARGFERAGGGRRVMSERDAGTGVPREEHVDEMTGLLYLEGQLEPARARGVSRHTEECRACRTLLRALERESRLLTRAMVEEDEALPARLLGAPGRAVRSLQWIWAAAFRLAATGIYALYTGYVQPWQQQLERAG